MAIQYGYFNELCSHESRILLTPAVSIEQSNEPSKDFAYAKAYLFGKLLPTIGKVFYSSHAEYIKTALQILAGNNPGIHFHQIWPLGVPDYTEEEMIYHRSTNEWNKKKAGSNKLALSQSGWRGDLYTLSMNAAGEKIRKIAVNNGGKTALIVTSSTVIWQILVAIVGKWEEHINRLEFLECFEILFSIADEGDPQLKSIKKLILNIGFADIHYPINQEQE